MSDEARLAEETLSRSGRPSTALARVQRYLGDPVATETFRATAARLKERAAMLVARDGLPAAGRACLQSGEACLEAGESQKAVRIARDLLPQVRALAPDEQVRLGFLLARTGDANGAQTVLSTLADSPAKCALSAVFDGVGLQEAANDLEAAICARGPEDAKPWADSVWWGVIGWMRGQG